MRHAGVADKKDPDPAEAAKKTFHQRPTTGGKGLPKTKPATEDRKNDETGPPRTNPAKSIHLAVVEQ
jgi:hypothetical protein